LSTRYIWRIWAFDSNDRQEVARVATKGIDEDSEFEIVRDFVLKTFIKPEFRSKVLKSDFGLEWTEKNCETCQEIVDAGDSACDLCEVEISGFQIENVGLEGESWGNEPELKTIHGTNEFYDLSDQKKPKKAADWEPRIKNAWDSSPELGIAALIVLGTPKKGIDAKYLEKCQSLLKEFENSNESKRKD